MSRAMPEIERPFVGRETELATLRAALGRGRLVLLAGEPGIGKTRVAEELAAEARARDAVVRWGRCWEGEGAPAFWPWIQIIREQVRESADGPGALARAGAELAALVPELGAGAPDPVETPGLDPSQARFRLFDGVTGFLKQVAAPGGLVLVLEDLHWADKPSLLMLQFLVAELADMPALVIATYRDVELRRGHALSDALGALGRHGHCLRLALAGLGAAEVRRYVELTLGAGAPASTIEALAARTEGNPLFLGELVHLMARERGEGGDAPPLPATVPAGIREAIARRLRGHSAACREILRVAAVVGREVSLAVLQEMDLAPHNALLDALGEALESRVLLESPGGAGRYRFSHALVRETLYDDLSLAERSQLHRRVGEALARCHAGEPGPHAAALAHHFAEAASEDAARRAVVYAAAAGAYASGILAHEEAVAHYRHALATLETWTPADEERACALQIGLGEALVRAGEPHAAADAFLRAAGIARRLGLADHLGEAALGLGQTERFHDRLGNLLEEALATLGRDDSVLQAHLLSRLAVTLYWSPTEDRKAALSEQAVAMARRLDHTPTLAYVLSGRIVALSGPDDVEARLAAATEMMAVAERCDSREMALVGRGWCVGVHLALGDVRRTRHEVETFARQAAELRHPYFLWWAAALRTMLALVEGRLGDAERGAHEELALGARAVSADATQVFAAHLYGIAMEQRRLETLEPVMRSVADQFPALVSTRCALALLYADTGRVAEAARELDALAADDFRVLPRNSEWLASIAVLAQTSALLPGAPHAARLYALLEPYRHRIIVAGMGVLCSGAVPYFLGLLATSLGRLDDAAAHLAEAARLHAAIESPVWSAYTRYETARLALARGGAEDRRRAAALIAEARQTAEALEMRRLAGVLDALGGDTGATGAGPEPAAAPAARPAGVFRKEGDYWTLALAGPAFRLKDSVGLHYIATLITHAGRELLAADLVAIGRRTRVRGANGAAGPGTAPARGDAGPLLDGAAKQAYKRRLEDLRAELDEACRFNDGARAERLDAEIQALAAELARAVGLGGRDRRAASGVERARVSATRAIQAALRRIAANDDAFGRHLAAAIRTGTFCSYTPDPGAPVRWSL